MAWSMPEAPRYSILFLSISLGPVSQWLAPLLQVALSSGSVAWPSTSHECSMKVGWLPLYKVEAGLLERTAFSATLGFVSTLSCLPASA